YVHAQGYVHRDVKPGNILFDANGHAFLSDFGVAKVMASAADTRAAQTAMTGAGMVLGTAEYMAPELIMGEPFDGRVDQYALAVTVYELLCGRRPFDDQAKTKVLVLHTTKAPPSPTIWCPTLPEPLAQAVLRGLAKDPKARYPSCAAMAAAVIAAAEGAVAREERVRLKCPACGTMGWMAAAEWTRLRQAGRRVACSRCKTAVDLALTAPERIVSGTGSGGTMRFTSSSSSQEYALPGEPASAAGGTMALSAREGAGARTPPPVPTAPSSGTTALSAPGSPEVRLPRTEPEQTPARRASRTVIERPARQSGQTAAPVAYPPPSTSARHRSQAHAANAANAAPGVVPAHPNPARIWIAAIAGALASFVVVLLAVWALFPRPEPKPAGPATVPKAAPVVSASSRPADDLQPPPPPEPEPPPPAGRTAPRPTDLAAATGTGSSRAGRPDAGENRPSAGPETPGGEPPTAKPPARDEGNRPSPPSDRALLAMASPAARPVAKAAAWSRLDLARLDRPVRAKVTLAKILASPQSYSGRLVEPAGMYHLTPSRASQTAGARIYTVTELTVESGRGGLAKISPTASSELEAEPRLADRLDTLDLVHRDDHVAILTVWVTGDGDTRLVKAEILEKTTYGVKPGYKHIPYVEYQTLAVTPVESRRLKGDGIEWEKLERLLHFANLYKNRFNAAKKKMKDIETDRIGAQMNSMFGQMMKDVMALEQQRQQLQRRLMGR
ncbi:MAG TPA: protein kinase, partial [Isosphaeraceae bacterium]|nr:protein kinase [Isosphaeraceae bacterium]